jgi:hypothetical protein
MIKAPRRLLLNDEGSSALHYLDLDAPRSSWTFHGPGRDLQLIGDDRVLRSTPSGFVELELAGGRLAREVALSGVSGIESAQRLPSGNTLLLGNSETGIFIWEVDQQGKPLTNRALVGTDLSKGRLLRLTARGTFLFCSDTAGKRLVHEADWQAGVKTLFRIPDDVPADSMLKALSIAPDRIVVSTGYSASLLIIDTARGAVVQTIGGKAQAQPAGLRRALSPNFFSGYQILPSGEFLIANWQGHGPAHGPDGYQLLMYSAQGELVWSFDQTEYPHMTSLNNVIALDGLDTSRLHDECRGVLASVI